MALTAAEALSMFSALKLLTATVWFHATITVDPKLAYSGKAIFVAEFVDVRILVDPTDNASWLVAVVLVALVTYRRAARFDVVVPTKIEAFADTGKLGARNPAKATVEVAGLLTWMG